MVDEREKMLAKNLVNYSCKVMPGQKVLIEHSHISKGLLQALINEVFLAGGLPFYREVKKDVRRLIVEQGSPELFKQMAKYDCLQMDDMDAVILALGANNAFEFAGISAPQMASYNTNYYKPVHLERRINKNWVTLRYPTPAFAQFAGLSTEGFEDFYFKVCNLDYGKMKLAIAPLKELMEKTDKVKIVAKNTNLEFSIKGIPAVPCCGEHNVPDGEIYTAPIKDSVFGEIEFNIPALIGGVLHNNIWLRFESGKIVDAKSSNTKELQDLIATDAGSRYLGEFAFGVNPHITAPINDILFDEKMCYSLHLAIGNSYDNAFNGNLSSIHADLIQLHAKEFGGGEVYFDNVLVRKNGQFMLPELVALNPENLV